MSKAPRKGLGLVELMLSLVIVAILLTAAATALNASIRAYAVNQEQATLMQSARVAMHRIATMIRTGKSHAPQDSALASAFAGGATVTGSAIALFDENDTDVVFSYDAANQRVIATIEGTPHVLARGVTAFSVTMEPMRSQTAIKTGGGYDLLKRATVLITVRGTPETLQSGETTGEQSVTLSISAAPRCNAW